MNPLADKLSNLQYAIDNERIAKIEEHIDGFKERDFADLSGFDLGGTVRSLVTKETRLGCRFVRLMPPSKKRDKMMHKVLIVLNKPKQKEMTEFQEVEAEMWSLLHEIQTQTIKEKCAKLMPKEEESMSVDSLTATPPVDLSNQPHRVFRYNLKKASAYIDCFKGKIREKIHKSIHSLVFNGEKRICGEHLIQNDMYAYLQFLKVLYLDEFEYSMKIELLNACDNSHTYPELDKFQFIQFLMMIGEVLAAQSDNKTRDILLHWVLALKILCNCSVEEQRETVNAISLEYKETVSIPENEVSASRALASKVIETMTHFFIEDQGLLDQVQGGIREIKKLAFHGLARHFLLFPKNQALAEKFFEGKLDFSVKKSFHLENFITKALKRINSIQNTTTKKAATCWVIALKLSQLGGGRGAFHYANEHIQDEELKRDILRFIGEVTADRSHGHAIVQQEVTREKEKEKNDELKFRQANLYIECFDRSIRPLVQLTFDEIHQFKQQSKNRLKSPWIDDSWIKHFLNFMLPDFPKLVDAQCSAFLSESQHLDRSKFIVALTSLGEALLSYNEGDAKDILLHWILTLKVLQNSPLKECRVVANAISNEYKKSIEEPTLRRVGEKERMKLRLINKIITLFDEEFHQDALNAIFEMTKRLYYHSEIGFLLTFPKNEKLAKRFFPDQLKFSAGDQIELWKFLEKGFDSAKSMESKSVQKAALCWLMALHLTFFEKYEHAHRRAHELIQDEDLKNNMHKLINEFANLNTPKDQP